MIANQGHLNCTTSEARAVATLYSVPGLLIYVLVKQEKQMRCDFCLGENHLITASYEKVSGCDM